MQDLDIKTRRWVADMLSNSEMCTDEELHAHFMRSGLDKETADAAMADRSFWECNIVLGVDEHGPAWYAGARPPVYKPTR